MLFRSHLGIPFEEVHKFPDLDKVLDQYQTPVSDPDRGSFWDEAKSRVDKDQEYQWRKAMWERAKARKALEEALLRVRPTSLSGHPRISPRSEVVSGPRVT